MTQLLIALIALTELSPDDRRHAKRELRRALVSYAKDDAEREFDSPAHLFVRSCESILTALIVNENQSIPLYLIVEPAYAAERNAKDWN